MQDQSVGATHIAQEGGGGGTENSIFENCSDKKVTWKGTDQAVENRISERKIIGSMDGQHGHWTLFSCCFICKCSSLQSYAFVPGR